MAELESFAVFTELTLDLVKLRLLTAGPNQHNHYRILVLKIIFPPLEFEATQWEYLIWKPMISVLSFLFFFKNFLL